ncbi:SulP family inorganic anion transporter [Reinekea marinisedimentorum]|uniref:SulP family sulfate permease n=1 Tax=Reinekea marinisedimentorum TaxID=230495 RepID=A0A4R3IAI7_9GAMM|nr:SulP family inorganic anion transporter [Reinekea marinisedimentorum]TCS43320.1 SulP family sulfate permease [Reinekea marinisedimentorum]
MKSADNRSTGESPSSQQPADKPKALEQIQGNDLAGGVLALIRKGLYGRTLALRDTSAAIIVTLMLIPQSLAYALVAGLPAEAGLYASILPLIAYALFGTSAALAVGPVAIISLLTANALVPLAEVSSAYYAQLALLLAALSGVFYVLLGVFRLGFLTQLLSYPVMKGFITSSSLLIVIGQIKPLTGIFMERGNLIERLHTLDISTLHAPSAVMGVLAMVILFWVRSKGGVAFTGKLFGNFASTFRRLMPMLLIVLAAVLTGLFQLQETGLETVGTLPKGLPVLQMPPLDFGLIQTLALPAFIITLIGMTESIAVGQTLGTAKRQRINANRELLGLGAANIAAGFSGGFPVTGGMSRSVVNADAGAETPIAGALTALFLSLSILFLTPWLAYIPTPVLAGSIIVAVYQLLEFPSMMKLLKTNRIDGIITWVTAILVLVWEVEAGLLVGVALSLVTLLASHRKPYMAVLGRIPGTERFKNINHAETETLPNTLFVRIDESLTFMNAGVVEQALLEFVAGRQDLTKLVLVASGIHTIDATGANMLKRFRQEVDGAGITFYMTDIKVPLARKLESFGLFDEAAHCSRLSTIEVFQKLALKPSEKLC